MVVRVQTSVKSGDLTFDAEVDGVAGGLPLTVLCPAGVGSVVFLLHSLQDRRAVIDIPALNLQPGLLNFSLMENYLNNEGLIGEQDPA